MIFYSSFSFRGEHRKQSQPIFSSSHTNVDSHSKIQKKIIFPLDLPVKKFIFPKIQKFSEKQRNAICPPFFYFL